MIKSQEVLDKLDTVCRGTNFSKLRLERAHFDDALLYKDFSQVKLQFVLGVLIALQRAHELGHCANGPGGLVCLVRYALNAGILVPGPE